MAKRKKECCRSCKRKADYEKELLLKIEEFRLARSHWLASKKEKNETNVNTEADLKKLNFRRDRHFKTVRPLPYFTFHKKLSDAKVLRMIEKEKEKEEARARALMDEQELKEFLSYEFELEKKKGHILNEREKEEAAIAMGIPPDKRKRKKKGRSEKALDNLKAEKQSGRLMESFKCNDGKEVTVVIKGFCLCDKDNVRKFKLDKIRENYKNLGYPKPNPLEEKVKPRHKDSLEVHKKRHNRKSKQKSENEEPELAPEESGRGKQVLFRKETGRTHIEDETINEKKDKERRRKEKDNAKKSGVETKQDTERRKKEEEDENREKQAKKERRKKESSPKKKGKEEEILKDSLVMLYKNRTPERSELGLTEEQSEKMKPVR